MTAPIVYFLGGVRGEVSTGGRAKPYFQGGFGVAHVKAKLDAFLNGTNVNALLVSYGLVNQSDFEQSVTKPMISFGSGFQFTVGSRGSVEFGYRFCRVFTDDPEPT